jgi:hypothetical protein
MSMRIDMTWHDNDAITYQASCAECSFLSHPVDDEDAARADWESHACA